jgi:hypothetical protein
MVRKYQNIQLFHRYLEKSQLVPNGLKELLILRRFKESGLKTFIDQVEQNFPFPVSYKIRDFQKKEEIVEFAYSEIQMKNKLLYSFRELSRARSNSWEGTKIVYGTKDTKKKVSSIINGEDPRLFFYMQEPWIYIQIYDEIGGDVEIRIRNLVTNIEFQLCSPLDFNGKNWIPFEKENQLHFIYSLEPLVVLKLSFNDQGLPVLKQIFSTKEFKPSWEIDFIKSIGRVRGGTPGIKFEEKIIGFTHSVHASPNYQFHTLGLFVLNLNDFELKLNPLSELSPGFLIDPYGAIVSKRKIQLFCSVVEGDLHKSDSNVANITIIFNINAFKHWLRETKII